MVEIQYNDFGTPIRFEIVNPDYKAEDVSAATAVTILLRAPDGTVLTKSGTFTTDGTDGKVQYTAVDGDLDQAGAWQGQARVTTPSGQWTSQTVSFKVKANLDS